MSGHRRSCGASQIQAPDRTAPILPFLPTAPARMTHDSARQGTTSLFAALDVASGSVNAEHHRHHQEFLCFLEDHRHSRARRVGTAPDLRQLRHPQNPRGQETAAAPPRFHLHFTPTSGSWLNLIERWFAELTNRKLRRSAHRSVVDLERNVRTWINEWNNDPKPFIWTKTADEILDTLTAYCLRVVYIRTQTPSHGVREGYSRGS
jgi:transposase